MKFASGLGGSDLKYKLKDLLEEKGYIRGPFGSALVRSELKEKGIPVYEQQHAIYNIRDFRFYIDEEKFNEMRRFCVREDDLLISCSGTVGKVTRIKKNDPIGIISQALLILRVNKTKVFPEYLKYFFESKEGYNSIVSRSSGSVQVNIAKREIIEGIELEVPEKEEQHRIVNILKSLDDKIELNNAINKNLEEMAQALFKRWFVDFEFPNENGEPYKSSGGEFEESELGLIPKGWKLDCLDGIADYLNGLAMQKYRPDGERFIPVIKIRELNQGRTSSESDKASPNIDKKYIVNNGDVLFSWSGTLDIRLWCGGTGGLNQHLFKVTSKNYDKWFYYYWTKYHIDRFRRIASDKATTMGHIKRSDLKEAKVLIPEPNSYKKATDVFKPIVDKVIQLSVESLFLERVRDTLLPKLMSGEIRVPVEQDHNDPDLPKVAESSAIYQP